MKLYQNVLPAGSGAFYAADTSQSWYGLPQIRIPTNQVDVGYSHRVSESVQAEVKLTTSDLTWRGCYIYNSSTIDGMIAQCDLKSPEGRVLAKSPGPFGVFTSKPIKTPHPRAPPSDTEELFGELKSTQLRNQAQILFHHYTSCTAFNMMPFQDSRNPWLSFYPSMARSGSAVGQKSLLYAILAQAAGNLAHLGHRREEMLVLAMMFYARAIRQLRESLEENSADFSVIMASILTLVMAEVKYITSY
jgi:Fungal specific transcription factor domain